jgi:protein-tyrosine phosphatase
MAYTANKIHDHLYQGGRPPPGDGLAKAGIDVLVLAAKEHQDAGAHEGLIVICAPGDDDLRPHRLARFIDGWRAAAEQVVEHIKAGRNVLVTCMAGQNRSGLIVGMALCMLTGCNGKEAVVAVQTRRPYGLNNSTFARYLIDQYP